MKPEDKKELINLVRKSKKVVSIFSILFTILLLGCLFLNIKECKTTLILTILMYSIYVFIRYIDKKLSS